MVENYQIAKGRLLEERGLIAEMGGCRALGLWAEIACVASKLCFGGLVLEWVALIGLSQHGRILRSEQSAYSQ